MNLGDLEFKADDFEGFGPETARGAADHANRLLRERLEKAKVLYFEYFKYDDGEDISFHGMKQLTVQTSFTTHTARLVCIEEVK